MKPNRTNAQGAGPWKLDLNERSDGAPAWIGPARDAMPDQLFWQYIDRGPLEKKIAQKFGLPESRVLATNGGDEGILYLINALEPGAPLFLPLPTFGLYPEQADFQPLDTVTIPPLADFSLNIAGLSDAIRARGGGMAVVVRPNNPTGELVDRATMLELIRLCAEKGTTLLVDEAYAEFAENNLIDFLDQNEGLVILRTFSKAHGLAGLRIGYLMGGPVVALKRRALPFNVAATSLYFAEKALDHQSEMEEYARTVALNRDRIRDRLTELGLEIRAGQANFLFLRIGEARAGFVAKSLAAMGIIVRSFSRSGLQGCLRITIPADCRGLERALEQVFNPDLICLDIDGCLIDIRESFDQVVFQTVLAFTGQKIERREILDLRARGGFNDDNVLAHALIQKRGRTATLEEVIPVFRRFYIGDEQTPGLCQSERPLAGPGLLPKLQKRGPVALVTGRNREEAALALPLLGLDERVELVTIDDVQRGKPDPEGILAVARKLDAKRVWMAGDNVDDILAARAAGAVPIGVSAENRADLEKAGAAIVLDNINEIEGLL